MRFVRGEIAEEETSANIQILLWALQLRAPMHEKSVPGRVFGYGRDILRKVMGSVGHLKKLCKLYPQTVIYLKGVMLIYRLMPP